MSNSWNMSLTLYKFFRRAETFSKRSRDVCDRVSDIKTFNESDDE